MSKRYDLENTIAMWCAKKELPQNDVVELVQDVLIFAGQVDIDFDNDKEVEEETARVRKSVKEIYARTLGYTA